MTLRITCPNCCESYPIDAGFADDDGKRLAALFAGMEPVLGRAVISYLRLFKPAKTSLRTARAIRIVDDLLALVRTGTVCRDERGGIRRPATPAMWAAGIEQLIAAPGKLSLPLANHHYLRAVVFGLADSEDAVSERAKEADMRVGKHRAGPSANVVPEGKLQAHLAWLAQQLRLGAIDQTTHDAEVLRARERFGAAS